MSAAALRFYERLAKEQDARRARAPRTTAILDRMLDALSRCRSHRIEMAIVGLGADLDAGHDLTDAEAGYYEGLLREVAA